MTNSQSNGTLSLEKSRTICLNLTILSQTCKSMLLYNSQIIGEAMFDVGGVWSNPDNRVKTPQYGHNIVMWTMQDAQ